MSSISPSGTDAVKKCMGLKDSFGKFGKCGLGLKFLNGIDPFRHTVGSGQCMRNSCGTC